MGMGMTTSRLIEGWPCISFHTFDVSWPLRIFLPRSRLLVLVVDYAAAFVPGDGAAALVAVADVALVAVAVVVAVLVAV